MEKVEKVEKVDNVDSMKIRYLKLIVGLFLCALAMVISINANIGYSPWDVFHQGLSNILKIKIGTANIMIGLLILIIAVVKGQKPGIGTICNMLLIGSFVNLIMGLNIIPVFSNLYIRILTLFVSMLITGLGSYMYIGVGFGAGPRDGLMLLLHEKTGKPIGFIRNSIEIIVLTVGYLLGGPVGIGTVILSLSVGYIIQFVFSIFNFDPNALNHRGWDDEMESLRKLMKNK